MKKNLFYILLLIIILCAKSIHINAQYSILHSFICAGGSGYSGSGSDIGFVSDGTYLYGIAKYGGIGNDAGAIFKMKFDSTNITYLHEFINDTAGIRPYGSLLLSDDTLYGVSTDGGKYGMGAIFKLKKDGTGFSRLFDFKDSTTGIKPESPLLLYGNVLYGKTWGGGWTSGSCIYKINKDGTGFSQIKIFNTPFDPLKGNIVIKGDYLYGITENKIFRINLVDTTYYELFYQNNIRPVGIILTDSILYCVTINGGVSGLGNIFKMNFDGTNTNTIFEFSVSSTGIHPSGNLCLFDSTFYGFASSGGKYNCGVIYEVKMDGSEYKKLFDFYSIQDITGKVPVGYLYYNDSSLYGLTYMRRNMTCYGGNIFKYKLGKQIQTSNILFNNITSNSVDISWTKGNGTKRLVFIKKGTNPISIPIDFSDYSLDYPFGSIDTMYNYCIYKDTGSFVTVNNLEPDTIYTVHAFEFWYIKNGAIPIYCDYDTVYNPASIFTLVSAIHEDPLIKNSFSLYPNPVVDYMTIQNNNSTIYNITISNEFGQIIFNINNCSLNKQIEMKDFQPGFYLIKIQTNDNVIIKKIFKI